MEEQTCSAIHQFEIHEQQSCIGIIYLPHYTYLKNNGFV